VIEGVVCSWVFSTSLSPSLVYTLLSFVSGIDKVVLELLELVFRLGS